jgi:hypothetical protein
VLSRSSTRNFLSRRKPSTGSVALRAIWCMKLASGFGVTPRISTARVARSMANRT